MVLFEGTAHPPPSKTAQSVADFNAAEIATTQLGDTPILVEHSGGSRGRVLSSWEGTHGELRVLGTVDCPDTERQIKNGSLGELSLGTSVFSVGDDTVHKTVNEVSLVEKGARHACLIDIINHKRVRTTHNASASSIVGTPQ